MNNAEARQFITSLLRSTGLGSYRKGDLLYASGPNTLSKLPPPPASSMVLHGGDQPLWASVSMSEIEGVLTPAQGGTGLSEYAPGDLIYAANEDTLARLPGQITTARQFLVQVGTGATSAAPAWDALTSADIGDFSEAAQDAAAALIANGTGISWSYNDVANTLTPTVTLAPFSTSDLAEGSNLYFTDERAQDAVAAMLSGSNGIAAAYNDAGNAYALALDLTYAPTWASTHTYTAAIATLVSSANPRHVLVETDQLTDEDRVDISLNGKQLAIRTRTSTDGAGADFLRFFRGTGTAVSELRFGNATNNPSTTFLGSGTVGFNGLAQFNSTIGFSVASAQARAKWSETDQATDEKNFEVIVSGKTFGIRTSTDADVPAENAYLIARGIGTAIASHTWRTANTDRLVLDTANLSCTLGVKSSSATAGIGYATGAGGTVTQNTSRTTGVTINKVCGSITLVSAAGSTSYQTFTVTNSTVAATDTVDVVQKSGTDKYIILRTAVAAGSFEVTFATTGGTTVEQPVFTFAVKKGVTA